MICEVADQLGGNAIGTWLLFTVMAMIVGMGSSSFAFAKLYWKPTFEQWQYKSNPKYPKPEQVKREVLLTLKCVALTTICPTLSLHLRHTGLSKAYCGWGGYSILEHVLAAFCIVVATDFFEWGYHYLGHIVPSLWKGHKSHHRFYNPSPFAVIADEAVDQLVRASPMLVFPMIAPVNMDVLFGIYTLILYFYGVYLHCGYELEWPDAHHPWINSSFQHYIHHAVGAVGKPVHTGFFVKFWDLLVDGDYTADMLKEGKCSCSKCARKRGERSLEEWEKVEKVDYSVLLKPEFWIKETVA
eukprot:TRINITY_DN48696_c0_g1_i1.p1 TRINITY_DN48696_c0_g1~~TRINITY_DN48696_c0_g1_i1.p1  ORF type:complete len:299 (+),score=53.10 TRINITY_DN48696_c0_g1_i1:181-1077(+)